MTAPCHLLPWLQTLRLARGTGPCSAELRMSSAVLPLFLLRFAKLTAEFQLFRAAFFQPLCLAAHRGARTGLGEVKFREPWRPRETVRRMALGVGPLAGPGHAVRFGRVVFIFTQRFSILEQVVDGFICPNLIAELLLVDQYP